jgi:phage-related protein
MADFKVIVYEKETGEIPVEDFLNDLNLKMRAKVYGMLSLLQEKGNMLREPYSKHLEDGIFELRCKFGSDICRVLYFFYYEGIIVLTNGFVKKTQRTPREEIQLAKDRRRDFIERVIKDENIG